MRSTSLFICLLLYINSFGQSKFSYDFRGKTLAESLEMLSKKKYKFSFDPKVIQEYDVNKVIKAGTEAALISRIFEDLPFKIQLSDGIYLIIPKKIKFKPTQLIGQINDQSTGKPLAFAHVQVNNKGTISNKDGRFVLPPREDTLILEISYLGYKPASLKVAPSDKEITLNLEQNPVELPEVILNSKEFNELAGSASLFSLNPNQFDALPVLGETDVFKSIQLLPGIKATDESSSGLAIRGSNPSQNLVLMDGLTLYHLDHFFGIFSTLNPNVINNINVYKGGFGAEYGGRTSSVVDVTGKAGSMEKFSGGIGLNILSMNGYLETPIGNKTSILIGGRRSFTDVIDSDLYQDFLSSNRQGLIESISPEAARLAITPSFNFYDLNGKVRHRFNEKSALDINTFFSEDFYDGSSISEDEVSELSVSDNAYWSNAGVSAVWKQMFHQNWSAVNSLSISEYRNDENLLMQQRFEEEVAFGSESFAENTEIEYFNYTVESAVDDITVRSNHEIALNNISLIKTGIDYSQIKTDYLANEEYLEDIGTPVSYGENIDIQAKILGIYGSYQLENENLFTDAGLRSSYYSPTGKWYLEPRFNIKYQLIRGLNIKGAASIHHQFINNTTLSFFENTDQFYWVLSDNEDIPIQKASHLIFGLDYSINGWTVDAEIYRKNMSGIIENEFIPLTPETLDITTDLIDIEELSGKNLSQGLDLFIKYRDNRYTSWISYSNGRSENTFSYLNNNLPYPSRFDQRHEFNWATVFKIGNWEFSSVLIYGSGRPYTPSLGEFNEGNGAIYDLEKINGVRLPDYSRIDLSAKYSFKLGKSNFELGATLFNILNTQNIKSRRYLRRYFFDESFSDDDIEEDEIRIEALDTYLLGFTPNFFLNINF